jgi:predicted patatin/cPLA2 family phospholipase
MKSLVRHSRSGLLMSGCARAAVLIILAGGLLCACATRPLPLPRESYQALPWGAINVQTHTMKANPYFSRSLSSASAANTAERSRYAVLLLSGGGAKGAFGAGLLCGWTKHGTRPQFKIVTGISTGALMATFVFLGPKYDRELKRFYTTTTDADVMTRHWFGAFGDSMADSAPLRKTIARFIDERVLEKVAIEHRKGRRLYVATTDLDGNRLVIWDMGAIAASQHSDRLKRYRDVLLASASLPIVFPPVYFPVEVNGKRYWQMHVDGGAISNVLFSGFMLDVQRKIERENLKHGAQVDFYIIMNGELEPEPLPQAVEPNLFSIATAFTWSTSWAAQVNTLARFYRAVRGMGFGFHLAGIPEDYPGRVPTTSFDPKRMAKLFRYARDRAMRGYPWLKAPPGLNWRELIPSTANGRISRISQQSSKRANSLEIDEAVITRSMRSSGDRN